MGIRVQYDAPAGLIGKTAFQTGEGKARQQLEMLQNNADEQEIQRAHAAEQQNFQRAHALEAQERNFQNQSQMAEESYQRRVAEQQSEQSWRTGEADKSRQFQNEQEEKARKAQLDAMTSKQKQEAQRYQDGIDRITKSTKLTDEERQKAMNVWRKQFPGLPDSIIDMADAGEDLVGDPYPKGQGIGQSWKNDDGDLMTRDDKGNEKILKESNRPTAKERLEIYKEIREATATQAGPDAPLVYKSHEELLSLVNDFFSVPETVKPGAPAPAQQGESELDRLRAYNQPQTPLFDPATGTLAGQSPSGGYQNPGLYDPYNDPNFTPAAPAVPGQAQLIKSDDALSVDRVKDLGQELSKPVDAVIPRHLMAMIEEARATKDNPNATPELRAQALEFLRSVLKSDPRFQLSLGSK